MSDCSNESPADSKIEYDGRLCRLWGDAIEAISSHEPAIGIDFRESHRGGRVVVRAAYEYVRDRIDDSVTMPEIIETRVDMHGAATPLRTEGRISRQVRSEHDISCAEIGQGSELHTMPLGYLLHLLKTDIE